MMITDAILLGGGLGKRFSGSEQVGTLPKQFQQLGNAPVFVHALRSLLSLKTFRQIIIVVPTGYCDFAQDQIDSHLKPSDTTLLRIIEGGARRQDSSYNALKAIEEITPLPTRIAVHDGCRPFLSPSFLKQIQRVLADRAYGAWVPVVPVAETLKRVENQKVIETVDRSLVHRVQTPQIFEYTVLRSLSEKVHRNPELNFTDDASLCEYYGIPVGTFQGDLRNIKVTYQFELELLSNVMKETCAPESDTTYTA